MARSPTGSESLRSRIRSASAFVFSLFACTAPPEVVPSHEGSLTTERPWPQEGSDMPPHPGLQFARLDNGLRLAWLDRAVPSGRCALRLVVHVGSLDEREGERGMAHFVEHMAFNGTRRFPGTSIVDWFQSQGMAFGRDVNAVTGFEGTTFKIDLARCDAAALAEGLEVLCDFSSGIRFDPEEVVAEIGVVDAEERERASPDSQAGQEVWQRLVAGTRGAERLPIGLRAERRLFTPESLREFHERWYRPDNMTLVIVGDLGTLDPRALVTDAFGARPRPLSPLPVRANPGTPTLVDTHFAIEQPDRPEVNYLIQSLQPRAAGAETVEELRRASRLEAACEMAYWTLADQTRSATSPVQRVRVL
ncbi:MAG: pitrilysin family protein, partial [Vicinamibacterales bacterium]